MDKSIEMGLKLDNALRIQGFMEPEELAWLAAQAQEHSCIVEVGSFLGRSTRALADNTPGYVLAFDDWFGPREIEMNGREHCFEVFLNNMNGLIEGKKVVVLSGNHGDESIIPDIQPDMVFIDGSHDYESVKRDIMIWKAKLAPGGLLCGHDVSLPDIQRALNELLPGWATATGTTIWGVPAH
jgi:predicted O-methyltransferase YrrM